MLKKLLLGTLVYCGYCTFAHSQEVYTYQKTTGSNQITTTYELDSGPEGFTINEETKTQTITITTTPTHEVTSFKYKAKNGGDFYNFTFNKGVLCAEGVVKGQKQSATYNLGSTLWIQEFEFGMRGFLKSNKPSIYFDILHPKNFKLYKMVAKKQKTEKIKINNIEHNAISVLVTLQGFKSMFWKGYLWYDAKTHDMLMYKANEGPHTPTTVITLKSKTGSL